LIAMIALKFDVSGGRPSKKSLPIEHEMNLFSLSNKIKNSFEIRNLSKEEIFHIQIHRIFLMFGEIAERMSTVLRSKHFCVQ